MKVLYISGYSRMVLFNKIIPKAIKETGCIVDEFDWNSVYKFNKVIKVFSDNKLKGKRNSEIIKITKSVKPDFIFVLKGRTSHNSNSQRT